MIYFLLRYSECLPCETLFAAAAAKSLQSCPILCDPIGGSPPGSSVHGILQARVLEWGAIAFSEDVIYISIYIYIYTHMHNRILLSIKK